MKKIYWVTYCIVALVFTSLFVEVMHTNVNGQGDLGWSLLYGFTVKTVCKWAGIFMARLFGYNTRELEK